MSKRMRREKQTIEVMIALYCQENHQTAQVPCVECQALYEYCLNRLDQCKFKTRKPACLKCPIHCYKPDMKEKIRNVMRYSGPKMIRRHPLLAISHLLDSLLYRKGR